MVLKPLTLAGVGLPMGPILPMTMALPTGTPFLQITADSSWAVERDAEGHARMTS